jgi:hypothetical protein
MGMANVPDAGIYADRLQKLCTLNSPVIREVRQSQEDPRLCLARLHVLKGNSQLAEEEAKGLLRGVFDDWPEDPKDTSLRVRYSTLAQILAVRDLDADAIAAWQVTKPRKSSNEMSEPSSEKPVAYISGYWCDGDCETQWKDMLADCWACKNCLCVQLCSPCHQKLQMDELHPLVCSKDHTFLYIPQFNQDLWKMTTSEMTIINGNTVVPRKEWINQLRDKLDMQQESIDAYKLNEARRMKATVTIASYILKWRKRKPKSKKSNSHAES